MNLTKKICIIALTISLFSCKNSAPQPEVMLQDIKKSEYFSSPFYAPMSIGRHILTESDHKNPSNYIKTNFGELIELGLLDAKVVEKNSWRTILDIKLTEQGAKFSDPRRSNHEQAYIMVCDICPTTINRVDTLGMANDTIIYHYTINQSNITPFGKKLGFEDGKIISAKASSVYKSGKWHNNFLH